MALQCMVPKKFLCRYELQLGAIIYGTLMIFVMIACIIATTVEMLEYTTCQDESVMRSAYAFCAITIIYSIVMIFIHLWFLWSVNKRKPSVILVWVVVNKIWLIQTTVLTVVLMGFYWSDTNIEAWFMCLVLVIIAFIFCVYGLLIGYGLWKQIMEKRRLAVAAKSSKKGLFM